MHDVCKYVRKYMINTKFKCACTTIYSILMSPFSHYFIKTIRYIQHLNLVNNYSHAYGIYSAPGFLMVEHQYLLDTKVLNIK